MGRVVQTKWLMEYDGLGDTLDVVDTINGVGGVEYVYSLLTLTPPPNKRNPTGSGRVSLA